MCDHPHITQAQVAAPTHPTPHFTSQLLSLQELHQLRVYINIHHLLLYQPADGTPYGVGYGLSHITNDLAKYLARSHLVSTGLTTHEGRPINYREWKASFHTAIAGLDLSAGEELNLLIQCLGKESAEHVKRIKTVNIGHLSVGLATWERLDQTYGSPEAVETGSLQ